MRTKEEIKAELAALMDDERLIYPPATVFENAPLALEQLAAEMKIITLQWALEIPISRFPLRKRKA